MLNFGLLNRGKRLPRQLLLLWAKQFDGTSKTFPSKVGASARPVQQLQYGSCTSGNTLTGTIASGVTVVSKEGTATVTPTLNTLTLGTGTLWSLVLSNGSRYEHPTKTGASSAMWFDVSGSGRHLTATVADVTAHCASSMTVGSDWLNEQGYSAGGLGGELVVNGGFDTDTVWTKGSGWSISDGKAVATGATASIAQPNSLPINVQYRFEFTVSEYTSGNVRANLGSNINGTTRNSTGTFIETLTPVGGDGDIYVTISSSFTGKVDNVSVKQSYPSTALIPALATTPTTDALGNPTQYPGKAQYPVVPAGAAGNCATFNGTSDYIATAILPPATGFLECDFVPSDLSGQKMLIGSFDNNNHRCYLATNGAYLAGGIGGDSYITILATVGQLTTGVKCKARIEWDGTTVRLLKDGEVIFTKSQYLGTTGNTFPLSIGAFNNSGVFATLFTGKIYNVNINGVTFPLSEGSGTTVWGYDSTGTTYTGTVTAADINAFWAGQQATYFHGLEYGYRLSGAVKIPANPYTGLACDGNAITNPAGYNASSTYTLSQAPELVAELGLSSDWFDGSGVPIAKTYAELQALSNVGPNVFLSATKGFAVYDPDVTNANVLKAERYYSKSPSGLLPTAFFNGVDLTGGTLTCGPTIVPDVDGNLKAVSINNPPIQGARILTTVAEMQAAGIPLGSNIVINGGFDTDTAWNKGTGWSIGSGVAQISGTAFSRLDPTAVVLTIGKAYRITGDFATSTGQVVHVERTTNDVIGILSTTSSFDFTFVAVEQKFYFQGRNSNTATIDNISVREIIPQALDTTSTGTAIAGPITSQATRTGNGTFSTFTAGTTFSRYAEDNPLLLPGILCEPGRTNYCLSSNNLANETYWIKSGTTLPVITSNAALSPMGDMTATEIDLTPAVDCRVSQQNSLSVAINSANTSVLSVWLKAKTTGGTVALRGRKGDGTYVTSLVDATTGWQRFSITIPAVAGAYSSLFWVGHRGVGGTCHNFYAWGSQIEIGSFMTSNISTTTASAQRNATVLSYPTAGKLRGNNFAIRMIVVPTATGQTNARLFGEYYSATEKAFITLGATTVMYSKQISSTYAEPTVAYSYVANRPIDVITVSYDAYGNNLCVREYNSSWSSWTTGTVNATSTGKGELLLASTCQIGALNSAQQFTGNIRLFDTLLLPDGLTDPLAYAKARWGLPA